MYNVGFQPGNNLFHLYVQLFFCISFYPVNFQPEWAVLLVCGEPAKGFHFNILSPQGS